MSGVAPRSESSPSSPGHLRPATSPATSVRRSRHFALHPPAARRRGRPPMPGTIPSPIRRSRPSRPARSTRASAGNHHRHCRCSPSGEPAHACPRPPTHALNSASASVRNCQDHRTEPPFATEHPRLNCRTSAGTCGLGRLKSLSLRARRECPRGRDGENAMPTPCARRHRSRGSSPGAPRSTSPLESRQRLHCSIGARCSRR